MYTKWILLPIISMTFLGGSSILQADSLVANLQFSVGFGPGHHQFRHNNYPQKQYSRSYYYSNYTPYRSYYVQNPYNRSYSFKYSTGYPYSYEPIDNYYFPYNSYYYTYPNRGSHFYYRR